MKYPLQEFVQGIADATGTTRAITGPAKYGESWEITLMSVNTNSTAQAQLRVYRGVESDTAQILSTYSANNDTAGGGAPIKVQSGENLVFVWTGADSGSVCTARLEGDLISGRR